MSVTALATRNGTDAITTIDTDRAELLRRTVVPKDITPDEFELFVAVCNRRRLDPFARQIYAVKRGGKMVIQVGIDGLRLTALRTGQYAGQDGPYWCGEDGVWHDVWLSRDYPSAARVGVRRKGEQQFTYAVAHWDEYVQTYQGKPTDMWARMPRNQLAKCAESLALRKAFPEELSGIYTTEEMAQADNDATPYIDADGVIHDAPAAAMHTAANTFLATPAQLEMLAAYAKRAGWDKAALLDYMTETYGKGWSKRLTVEQAAEAIEYIVDQIPPDDDGEQLTLEG